MEYHGDYSNYSTHFIAIDFTTSEKFQKNAKIQPELKALQEKYSSKDAVTQEKIPY